MQKLLVSFQRFQQKGNLFSQTWFSQVWTELLIWKKKLSSRWSNQVGKSSSQLFKLPDLSLHATSVIWQVTETEQGQIWCFPGWIPGRGVIFGLSLLLVFLRVLQFSPLLKYQHFQIPILAWKVPLAPISARALDIFDTSIKWIIIILITIIIMDKNGLSCKGNGWGFSLSLHRLRWNFRDPAIGISLTSSPIWGTYGEMRFTVQMSQSGGWYKVSNSCTSSTLGFLDGCK